MGDPCHHHFPVGFLDHAIDLVGKVVGVLIPPILLQLEERRKLAVQQDYSILVKRVVSTPDSCNPRFNVGFIRPLTVRDASLTLNSLRSCRAGTVLLTPIGRPSPPGAGPAPPVPPPPEPPVPRSPPSPIDPGVG